MLPTQTLEQDLRTALAAMGSQPLAELLHQQGLLRSMAAERLKASLRSAVRFTSEEESLVIARLWHGLPVEPPASLGVGWLQRQDPQIQPILIERWDQILLQKWMDQAYRDRIETYFLERREDLEQVVYGMIRLKQQGVAEELYLRLIDDEADFGQLAVQYSLGEERLTRGLVGPMLISQPHPAIRRVLQTLTVGEIHPPLRVDQWVLLLRMEHRQPARLSEAMRLQLAQELLQRDLDATLDAVLAELLPRLSQPLAPVAEPIYLVDPDSAQAA